MTEVTSTTKALQKQLMKVGRVGVLYGGYSAERDVSLKSGAAVTKALESLGVDVVAIDLQAQAIDQIAQANLDRVFIALHGKGGEDGRVQALLEFMGLPYTGSGVQASSLAMDKWRSKQIFSASGLPTPEYEMLADDGDFDGVMQRLGDEVMVKPAHEGSSIGMAKVDNVSNLKAAYENACQYDKSVFAEKVIHGSEYTVAILGDRALPPIKLETDSAFYDYEAKYISNDTRYICPCGLNSEMEEKLKSLALKAFNAVGCEGWGRVDFMADEQGNFYLLEINTVPGMTSHSLVPMAAAAEGVNFEELVGTILLQTLLQAEQG